MSKSRTRIPPRLPYNALRTRHDRNQLAGPWPVLRLAAHDREIARKGPLMAKGSPFRLLLIVTGSTLRAEELDRPLGYYLKQRIEAALAAGQEGPDQRARPVRLPGPGRGRLPLDPRRVPPEPADDLAGGPGRQRPGASLARGGPDLAGLQRAVLHPDGPRPRRAPRQHLGHGQPDHPDRRLRLPRPLPAPVPGTLRLRPRDALRDGRRRGRRGRGRSRNEDD